ncbi:cyclohexanecarboxylate-CoA ligase [Rhodococcus rhodochrous J3]|uniref:Cyclohexanecarboxylate-CoA ligase n=1 Tax=Rhodococcus rhodochrous J3 TaxID=903528 RepID=A0ABY1MJJ4_RHORH|nr:AMP-binding protein [Rhodococcus rhodochrous]MBF4478149.1 AMP-binding protein [Rhodococcus rhodochrous]MCD2099768.1 AMP-binding protein [Rhodococcus rhodochrous]MCD2124062.1 AMP-binding protein [Rhodococcus rhodochrous]MCQ4136853.1 AMP-binding protein [Rhodococcus rhodochrous]MDJ0020819.1 AMP-binding protein [Rhodococcus rhodochrous]
MTHERNLGRYTSQQVEEFYASGQWADENFTEILRARAESTPDKIFLTDGAQELTFSQLYDKSQQLALGLRRTGLRSGDRVAVQLPNWGEFVVVAAALTRIGVVTVPIMPIYRMDEVSHIVADASIRTAIAPAQFKGFDYVSMFDEIRRSSSTLETIIAVRASTDIHQSLAERNIAVLENLIVETEPEVVDTELDFRAHPDDPFVIVYTSGTTSRPKGCLHTFNTYASGARALKTAFGHTESDVQFGPSPITHTTGLVTSVLLPLLSGAATHIMAEWSPERGLAEIRKYGCTAAVTATTFLQTLVAAAEEDPDADLSSLRVWVCAGAPIPAAVVERAKSDLPTTAILSLYGRSENLTTTTCTIEDDPSRAVNSDGAALPGAEVKIVDSDGLEVPRGSEGDIAYRGPSHMIEYLNRAEDTAELFTPEGFSRSGDLGVMDADGFVRVTGRTKDIVIRGGMNISVREVEDKLADHPDILALAVVGMPDERLGEKVCCYVVPKDERNVPTLDHLRNYLLERGVAIQKTPERVEVIAELPMTATGKIQKHILRKRIAEALDAGAGESVGR